MTDPSPTADRSLADRVDAIERALTDDTDGRSGGDRSPLPVRVAPERLETLEADLEALRAAVDALRGVVDDLDRPTDAHHARDAGDVHDSHHGDGTSSVQSPAPAASNAPDDDLGDLFAPTGRTIPAPDTAVPDATAAAGTGADEADTAVEDTAKGVLARVTETL